MKHFVLDVGQEWFSQLPSSWCNMQAKWIFSERNDRAAPGDQQLSVTQSLGVVRQRDFMVSKGQRVVLALSGIQNFKHIDVDDFVISLRTFEGGIEHSPISGCVSPAYTVIRALAPVSPRYWKYFFKSHAFISSLRCEINESVRDGKSISYEQFGAVRCPNPSLSEQVDIARFLDHGTARIDGLIERKTRFIALLREKRQALITRAVTRGLNAEVPMKDSGVEWLGQVPAHWAIPKLRHIATVQTGLALGKNLSGPEVVTVPYLRVANVQNGYLKLDDVATVSLHQSDLSRYLLREGDVLMNEGGDNDKLGRGHVWRGEIEQCVHQNHVFAIRPHGVSSEWLNCYKGSSAAQAFFTFRAKQTTNLASISSSNLLDLPVPCPPVKEQAAILDHIGRAAVYIDTLITKTERSITLLREKRTALITAAVTGKIDLAVAA